MRKHIVLLADIKGTKNYLAQYIDGLNNEIVDRMELFQTAFSKVVLEFMDRSRTMHAYTFSDSVFVRWDSYIDGKTHSIGFAKRLYSLLDDNGLPTRVYINEGSTVPERDSVGDAISQSTGRLVRVFPISTGAWSVFVADESRFPNGIFVGGPLCDSTKGIDYEEKKFEAGPFVFRRLAAV